MATGASCGYGRPRRSVVAARSPITNTSGWAATLRSCVDDHFTAGGLREPEQVGERIRLHAGAPDHRVARDARPVGQLDAVRIDGRDRGVEPDLARLVPGARVPPRLCDGAENALRSEPVASMSTTSADLTSSVSKSLASTIVNSSASAPLELHAGRSAAGDHDAERAVVDQRVVPVGGLELLQHRRAHLDRILERLEGSACSTNARDTEVTAHRARREDQVVVGDRIAVGDQDTTPVEVDPDDARHLELGVRLSPHHAADARRDVVGRDAGGRDLVEERRERVEVVLVDQRDVDRGTAKRTDSGEPAEAGADDDDVRPIHHRSIPESVLDQARSARAA